MKRFCAVVTLVLVISLVSSSFALCVYPLTAVVVEVNYKEDYILCVDYTGNEWAIDGAEDWMIGDVVAMIMDECGTDEIFDDAIVDSAYCGCIDLYMWLDR